MNDIMNILRASLESGVSVYSQLHLSTVWVFLVDAAVIYINLYVLIRYLLMKNRFWSYFSLSFLLLIIDITISTYFYLDQCDCIGDKLTILGFFDAFIGSAQDTIFFMGTAIGLKLFKIWLKNQKKIKMLENENLKTELNYLKSQMNPHFLFNTLNNIYVQTKIDHNSASQTILKLSDLLRYQLYDCSKDRVKMASEIDYLKNYLELERIRKSKLAIEFNLQGNVNGLTIPPFLFIAFIENAIKHGNTGANAYIRIELIIDGKQIVFRVENSVHESFKCVSEGGLGLSNVKRRLELLFPDKHKLEIKEDKKTYKIELNLDLS